MRIKINKSLIIKEIIKHYNFKKDSDFADFLGIAPTTLSSWQARNSFDIDLLYAKCEDISPEWLLTGKGNMLRGVDNQVLPVAKQDKDGIPYIPLSAAGGSSGEIYEDLLNGNYERYVIPLFNKTKVDYLISVTGSSMSPKYNSGDVLACKFVPLDAFIQWNKPYVIDTISNGAMVKRIKKSLIKDNWLFVSDNESYEAFDVPITDIRSIALVVGVVRLE